MTTPTSVRPVRYVRAVSPLAFRPGWWLAGFTAATIGVLTGLMAAAYLYAAGGA